MLRLAISLLTLLAFTSVFAYKANPSIRSGNSAYEDEKYTDAEVEYRKGIQADKYSVESVYNLANSLYKQEKYKEAATEFEKASKLTDDKEKLSSIYHNMGNSLYKAEDYGNSIEAYKNALKNNPKDDDTRFNLALAQKKLQAQQQQQQQNQDKKEDNKDKQQQQQQQQEEKKEEQSEQKEQPQQPQQNKEEMSQEAAEQILDAFSQDEKQLQEEMQRRKGGQRSLEKDW